LFVQAEKPWFSRVSSPKMRLQAYRQKWAFEQTLL
jgi:hypothetical protein